MVLFMTNRSKHTYSISRCSEPLLITIKENPVEHLSPMNKNQLTTKHNCQVMNSFSVSSHSAQYDELYNLSILNTVEAGSEIKI